MALSPRHFAQCLNHCLDETGAPANARERAAIISKLLNIPKPQAWSLIAGQQVPDPDLLQLIATEFDVEIAWLSGEK